MVRLAKSAPPRAAVSIPSDLAEGAGRGARSTFARFVSVARDSLDEVETQYPLAVELGFADNEAELHEMMERLHGLPNGLRNALMDRSTID